MTWIANELERAEQIKAKRNAWTPAQIQANLDRAEERYNNYPTNHNAYSKRAAADRVAATPVLVWVHVYGEWATLNDEFQTMLKDIRENDGKWSAELEEARYQASEAVKLARVAVDAQNCTAHIERFNDRPSAWPARMVAPHLRCAELRAEWRENGGI